MHSYAKSAKFLRNQSLLWAFLFFIFGAVAAHAADDAKVHEARNKLEAAKEKCTTDYNAKKKDIDKVFSDEKINGTYCQTAITYRLDMAKNDPVKALALTTTLEKGACQETYQATKDAVTEFQNKRKEICLDVFSNIQEIASCNGTACDDAGSRISNRLHDGTNDLKDLATEQAGKIEEKKAVNVKIIEQLNADKTALAQLKTQISPRTLATSLSTLNSPPPLLQAGDKDKLAQMYSCGPIIGGNYDTCFDSITTKIEPLIKEENDAKNTAEKFSKELKNSARDNPLLANAESLANSFQASKGAAGSLSGYVDGATALGNAGKGLFPTTDKTKKGLGTGLSDSASGASTLIGLGALTAAGASVANSSAGSDFSAPAPNYPAPVAAKPVVSNTKLDTLPTSAPTSPLPIDSGTKETPVGKTEISKGSTPASLEASSSSRMDENRDLNSNKNFGKKSSGSGAIAVSGGAGGSRSKSLDELNGSFENKMKPTSVSKDSSDGMGEISSILGQMKSMFNFDDPGAAHNPGDFLLGGPGAQQTAALGEEMADPNSVNEEGQVASSDSQGEPSEPGDSRSTASFDSSNVSLFRRVHLRHLKCIEKGLVASRLGALQ